MKKTIAISAVFIIMFGIGMASAPKASEASFFGDLLRSVSVSVGVGNASVNYSGPNASYGGYDNSSYDNSNYSGYDYGNYGYQRGNAYSNGYDYGNSDTSYYPMDERYPSYSSYGNAGSYYDYQTPASYSYPTQNYQYSSYGNYGGGYGSTVCNRYC